MSFFYRDLFNHRQQGDYDDFVDFSYEEVCAWHEEANVFMARISKEIEQLLSDAVKE